MKPSFGMECLRCLREFSTRIGSRILVMTILLIFNCKTGVAAVPTSNTFTRDIGCYTSKDQSLVFAKCLVKKQARSLLHCVSLCSASLWCSGAAKDALGNCYFYTPCDYITIGSCGSQGLSLVQVYRKREGSTSACGSEGTMDAASGKCSCSPGWSGVYCETPPRACTDAKTTGLFWLEVKLYNTVRILCDVSTSGDVKVYAFKNDGTSNHNKSWAQYSEGYVINERNFWIGLDNMRTIISQSMTSMNLEVAFNNSAYFYYWNYTGVAISNSSTHYKFTYVSSKLITSTLTLFEPTNCISSAKEFSTFDSDNDGDWENLAAKGAAGWWFEDTGLFNNLICNPMGRQPWITPTLASSTQMIFPEIDLELSKYEDYFTYVGMYFYK